MATEAAIGSREHEFTLALSDDRAFQTWYDLTVPRVYSFLMSRCAGDATLVEELTQETFIAAIRQRARFDGRADAVTWLCAIARHKLADHFRQVERDERREMRLAVRQLELEPVAGASQLEEREAIGAALRRLPAAQRAMLTFVALDGLSVADAGRLIGKRPGAAQSLLNRAREGFRRAYGREVADD